MAALCYPLAKINRQLLRQHVKTDISLAGVGDQTQAAEAACEIELCPSSHNATLPRQIVENSLTYEVNGRNMVG
jgi:hypothetical protein